MSLPSPFPQPSQRLRDMGFSYDPFAWQHAENMQLEVLEETFTAHPYFDQTILNLAQSAVLSAPFGGGKTAGRLRLTTSLMRKQKDEARKHIENTILPSIPLVIQYDDFESMADSLPNITIKHHINPLLASVADSVLNFIISYPELYRKLNAQDCEYWWSFINNYKVGEWAGYALDDKSLLSDWQSHVGKPPPFTEGTGLREILESLIDRLNPLMVDTLFILVDNVDSIIRDRYNLNSVLLPLLNYSPLFSLKGIIWKFFLPSELEETVQNSESLRTNQINLVTIKWDLTTLKTFLSRRLFWASEGKISDIAQQCEQPLIMLLEDIDIKLAELALQHKFHGPPRAILELSEKLYHRGSQSQITPYDWENFVSNTQNDISKKFQYDVNSQPDYKSLILRINGDKGISAGTAFLTLFKDKIYVVTCAHVLSGLGRNEGDLQELIPMKYNLPKFSTKILWCHPPLGLDEKAWSAMQDIAILGPVYPASNINWIHLASEWSEDQAQTDCWCFGYSTSKVARGAWIENINCDKEIGDGFVVLKQQGKERVSPGVSGAPLYCPNCAKIIGMIQAEDDKDKDAAYLIPSYLITNILETAIPN